MDSYLAISAIANDEAMIERMKACATQQVALGNAPVIHHDPINKDDAWAAVNWVDTRRYLWASSPGWGEAWAYALNSGNVNPGKDESVITDGMILSAVQTLTNPSTPSEEP